MARDETSQHTGDFTQAAESKARFLFWASLILNMLIALQFVVLALSGGRSLTYALHIFLVAMLLWSFVISAHAFHLLSRLAGYNESRPDRFTDPHTRVYKREYLIGCLEQEYKRAVQTSVPAAVAYVDMVNLDRVNKRFGYTVGDIALKAVAQAIAESVRPGDTVGRVGGDEFLVIMPRTTSQEAASVAAAISRAVKGYRLDLGKRGTIDDLGCRVGVASYPGEGQTPDDIIAAAQGKLA